VVARLSLREDLDGVWTGEGLAKIALGSLAVIARHDVGAKREKIVGAVIESRGSPDGGFLCPSAPMATDWGHVDYRSGQATTLFPIGHILARFVGLCPYRRGSNPLRITATKRPLP